MTKINNGKHIRFQQSISTLQDYTNLSPSYILESEQSSSETGSTTSSDWFTEDESKSSDSEEDSFKHTTKGIVFRDKKILESDEEDLNESDSFNENIYKFSEDITNSKNVIMKDPEFIKLVTQIPSLDPDFKIILDTPMRKNDKIKLTELFLIMISQEQFTLEWVEMREHIKKEFEKAKKKFKTLSNVDHERFVNEIKRLKTITDIPLKEQIVSLDACDNTKLAIYRKYKEMKQYQEGENEYAKLNSWIKFALSVPYNRMKVIDVKGDVEIDAGANGKLEINGGDLALVTRTEKENIPEIKIYNSLQEECKIIRATIFYCEL